jgi:hypothetical protein
MVQEKSIKGSSGATSAFSQGLADLASDCVLFKKFFM